MVKIKGAGRNTESFDPKSTIVRPDMRILVGQPEDKYSGIKNCACASATQKSCYTKNIQQIFTINNRATIKT